MRNGGTKTVMFNVLMGEKEGGAVNWRNGLGKTKWIVEIMRQKGNAIRIMPLTSLYSRHNFR